MASSADVDPDQSVVRADNDLSIANKSPQRVAFRRPEDARPDNFPVLRWQDVIDSQISRAGFIFPISRVSRGITVVPPVCANGGAFNRPGAAGFRILRYIEKRQDRRAHARPI